MCDFCKPFGIWEYRLDKLAEEVDICFREKKMGKRRGRLPNVRGRERMYAERLRISQTLGRRSSAFDEEEEN